MRRHSRIDGVVEDWIRELALLQNWSAPQICREIEKRVQEIEEKGGDRSIPVIPHKRTVERLVKEIQAETKSTAETVEQSIAEESLWDFIDDEAEAVFNILEVRRQFALKYRRSLPRFTKKEASDLKAVFGAAPGIPPYCAYVVVQQRSHYQLSQGQTELRALEDYLAFKPWEGRYQYQRYVSAVEEGVVPKVPAWEALVKTIFDGWDLLEHWELDGNEPIDEFLVQNSQ